MLRGAHLVLVIYALINWISKLVLLVDTMCFIDIVLMR